MSKIIQAVQFIQALEKRDFQKYLIIVLLVVAFVALGGTYFIYQTTSGLTQEIKKLNTQSNKIAELIAKNTTLEQEEEKIQKLLQAEPDFNINSFFEKFYTKHNIRPESGWKPEEGISIEGTNKGTKFQEIKLKAIFKGQTMQKLVSILQDIYKEEKICLKNLEITRDDSKISFELTLATQQYIVEALT